MEKKLTRSEWAAEMGRRGGPRRMLTLTAEQRTAIARKGGLARQAKRRQQEGKQ